MRFLSNLLIVQDALSHSAPLAAAPIHQPVFITGLPRSGTTFLHRLMLTDPANRAPTVWETIYPSPAAGTREQRIARVARQLKAFEWLAPEFRVAASAGGDVAAGMQRDHRARVPQPALRYELSYSVLPELAGCRCGAALSGVPVSQTVPAVSAASGRRADARWVLKCPEHLFALEAIRTVYPDARLVFVHRDPVKVLLSQARLTEVLRRPFTRRLDPKTLGPDESRRWLDGTRRMMAVGDDAGFPEPVCHVHHMDLVSDPASTVEGVYRHFGMTLPPQMARAIETYVTSVRTAGTGSTATISRITG